MKSNKLPPIHPGQILKEEILASRKVSQTQLAHGINVPSKTINEICQRKRNISAEIALRLAVYFGISAQFWMNLQQHYDLEVAKDSEEEKIKKEVRPLVHFHQHLNLKEKSHLKKHF